MKVERKRTRERERERDREECKVNVGTVGTVATYILR
jgi:hypothetical protein